MKKVNPQQIKKIEAFLIKKEIVYYDLQQELLDHICTSIEEQWEKNPNLTFDQAFHIEYKNFGIFGFSDIMEKRESDLKTYYWKQIAKHGMNWFKVPQLFLTLIVFYCIYEIMLTSYNLLFIQISFGSICIISITLSIFLQIRERNKLKQQKPILLMDKVIAEVTASSFIVYLPFFQGVFFEEGAILNTTLSILIAIFLTLLFFAMYMVLYDFPKNKKKYFKHKYNIA